MAGDAARAFDRTVFRKVMGSFATGVTVISTRAGGEVRGMTANAFMSGSLEPPLCIVSVALRARMHAFLMQSGHFGVSILAQGQEGLSAHYGGSRMANVEASFESVNGTPVLRHASATIAARVVAQHECGDHSIFLGHIFHMRASGGAPLVVHEGRYASLIYSEEYAPEPNTDFW